METPLVHAIASRRTIGRATVSREAGYPPSKDRVVRDASNRHSCARATGRRAMASVGQQGRRAQTSLAKCITDTKGTARQETKELQLDETKP